MDIEGDFRFLAHETPRPGQIEMIYESREALRKNGYHLAAAPTGIGKTAASLAAALEIARLSDEKVHILFLTGCLLYTSPSPRDVEESRMPSSA